MELGVNTCTEVGETAELSVKGWSLFCRSLGTLQAEVEIVITWDVTELDVEEVLVDSLALQIEVIVGW